MIYTTDISFIFYGFDQPKYKKACQYLRQQAADPDPVSQEWVVNTVYNYSRRHPEMLIRERAQAVVKVYEEFYA